MLLSVSQWFININFARWLRFILFIGACLQVQLVTPHSLWLTKTDTWKLSNILLKNISVTQNVCVLQAFNFIVPTFCLYLQLQWMRLKTLPSPLSVPMVTWRWLRLSSTSMLIQTVSVYQCCYVVTFDDGLPQIQSTRLVTLHSLWPVLMATWTQSSTLWTSIIVILKVRLQLLIILATSWRLYNYTYR